MKGAGLEETMKQAVMWGRAAGLAMLLIAVMGVMGLSSARAGDDPAGQAALAWLKLVDQAKYQDSWQSAGPMFQKAVSAKQWTHSLEAVRTPLGAVLSRKEAGRQNHKQLPGAPYGEYLVFSFRTSFAHKAQAVETLTLRRQPDGTWRAAGYFIR
jgi:hypothetical protein